MPDATSNQIIQKEIIPAFKSGNFPGGITAGVTSIMAATKGEYEGGRVTTKVTKGDFFQTFGGQPLLFIILLPLLLVVVVAMRIYAFAHGIKIGNKQPKSKVLRLGQALTSAIIGAFFGVAFGGLAAALLFAVIFGILGFFGKSTGMSGGRWGGGSSGFGGSSGNAIRI